MAHKLDPISVALVAFATLALALGLDGLVERADLPALFWLVAGGLGLLAASERERAVATR